MGNELAQHETGYASGAASAEAGMPGRSSLADLEGTSSYEDAAFEDISSEESDVARAALRAGERVTDRGNFGYVAQADGAFEVVEAPPPFAHAMGKRISIDEIPAVWGTIYQLLAAKPASMPAAPKPARAPRPAIDADARAANDARVRPNAPTVAGSTLDIAKTKADEGAAATHYAFGRPAATIAVSGDPAASTFYCSSFAMWTLAAAGYDLQAGVVGKDGVPFTYAELASTDDEKTLKRRRGGALMKKLVAAGITIADRQYPTLEKQITFRALIDGYPLALRYMTKAQTEHIENGTLLGADVDPGMAGTVIFDDLVDGDATATAAKGLAGAFELLGIGREVPELDQKPGDFAQSRHRRDAAIGNVPADHLHHGDGHAFQVWSVRAKGDAMFGERGSPTATATGDFDGWTEDVDFVVDRDTDPALVGEHTITSARRIEAQVQGAMTDKAGGDGGVQIGKDQAVPMAQPRDGAIFYGRLASSPWEGWTPATKPVR